MFLFSNNARAILQNALPSSSSDPDYDTIVITDADDGKPFVSVSEGSANGQLATLTHPSMPGIYEVVRIVGHFYGTDEFTVQRGFELGEWAVQAWPAGTIMEARITAETLAAFPQQDTGGVVRFANSDSGEGEYLLAGFPYLRDQRSKPTNGTLPSPMDALFAPEVVGGSIALDLAVPANWASGTTYSGLAVVKPAVSDGFQYWLDLNSGEGQSRTNVAVVFNGLSDTTLAYDGDSPNQRVVGRWVPTAMPVDIQFVLGGYYHLVLTEVGFQTRAKTSSTTPSISVGTSSNRTRFVNNQALSQITSAPQMHRFPITAGGDLADSLRFSVDTAGTGGVFRGRFFWRGFFLANYD